LNSESGATPLLLLSPVDSPIKCQDGDRRNRIRPHITIPNILTPFFVLADPGRLPFWVALLMMAREIAVDGVRAAGAVQG
jgi:hypothetical protein